MFSYKKQKDGFWRRFGQISCSFFSITLYIGFSALFAGGLVGLLALYILYQQLAPDIGDLRIENIAQTSRMYDRSGQHILYELYDEENRTIVGYEDIPDSLRVATVVAEDERFYKHSGVDFIAVARAIKKNFQGGSVIEGGSTITMQLARNIYFSRRKTYERKIAEAITALKIERTVEKKEILQWYLNIVPYGSNTYGVQAAAQMYFGKNASELTLDEAVLLAAIPKATTYYSPYGENTAELRKRQQAILIKMRDLNLWDKEEIRVALAEETLSKVLPFRHPIEAPHFVMAVVEELKQTLGEDVLQRGGLLIRTTLDWDKQQEAERVVREGVKRNIPYGASNAALVAIDPRSGEVLVMVGSKDYFDTTIDGQVNVAMRPRQPGSAFKPIVYARAFELGFQPETTVYDVLTNFGPDGSGKEYIPRNYSGTFRGRVTFRQALAGSLNIPAVKVLYLSGVEETIDLAHRMGITTLNEKDRYGLALVLGGGEITLIDGVSAFSVFANDGARFPTYMVSEVRTSDNRLVNHKENVSEQVISHETARKINSILSDNEARSPVFGSQSPLVIPGKMVAAKTGTTQEFHDAWTMGYTPSISVGVWVGNNDNTAMKPGSDGIYVAAPIWNNFMQKALQDLPSEAFPDYQRGEGPVPIPAFSEGKVVYYHKGTGEKISEEKAGEINPEKVERVIEGERHDILYYIQNRSLTQESIFPQYSSEMARRWDEALP